MAKKAVAAVAALGAPSGDVNGHDNTDAAAFAGGAETQ